MASAIGSSSSRPAADRAIAERRQVGHLEPAAESLGQPLHQVRFLGSAEARNVAAASWATPRQRCR
jgi:hypothetical protein